MMITRQKVGVAIIGSAVVAWVPNYLWLIGLMTSPGEDLMVARWIYGGFMLYVGWMVGWGA